MLQSRLVPFGKTAPGPGGRGRARDGGPVPRPAKTAALGLALLVGLAACGQAPQTPVAETVPAAPAPRPLILELEDVIASYRGNATVDVTAEVCPVVTEDGLRGLTGEGQGHVYSRNGQLYFIMERTPEWGRIKTLTIVLGEGGCQASQSLTVIPIADRDPRPA